MLEVKDIHSYYGKSHILQGVSMSLNEGELVCLLGRNGVGKSTTLKSIMGLVKPSEGSVRFRGTGSVRTVYLTILLTHTVLAAIVPFLAVTTLVLARKGRFDAHRRLARVTLPVWLYVSVTGVVIYLMLYRMDF